MRAPDDDDLLDAAASIADGTDVEWDRLQQPAGDSSSTALIRELQALHGIASFYRRPDRSGTSTIGAPPAGRALLGTWGHLTLVDKIAEGGFGAVYRAHDPKLQTDVALKLVTLPADRADDAARALKEARLLARVRHPHVVRVYGADIIGGYVGVWMEFVDGQTLASLLRARGPFGAREAALIVRELCGALAAVHAAGLIHGDVKAHNVMREAGGRIVLMDFGTGKDLRTPAGRAASDVVGTPLYIAPEVFKGERRSILSDVYGLGVLLYHLVTNGYPFDGRSQADVENAHRRGARTPVRDARPDLPREIVDIVERAIAVDPRDRYESAGAFETALATFLGRRDPSPVPVRMLRLLAAIVIAAAAIGGAYWYWFYGRTPSTVSSSARVYVRAPVVGSYRIAATLHRRNKGGPDARLRGGDRVAAGDEIYAVLKVSAPTYVYIVNEDDRGESFLLFPLPGQAIDNPLPPGTSARIPGTRNETINWQISTNGGHEHFLIFASPERLQAFEELFATLPRPSFGARVTAAKLPATMVGKLRGVGGLSAPAATGNARLSSVFMQPLGDDEETAEGLFVRQLTIDNPM